MGEADPPEQVIRQPSKHLKYNHSMPLSRLLSENSTNVELSSAVPGALALTPRGDYICICLLPVGVWGEDGG